MFLIFSLFFKRVNKDYLVLILKLLLKIVVKNKANTVMMFSRTVFVFEFHGFRTKKKGNQNGLYGFYLRKSVF